MKRTNKQWFVAPKGEMNSVIFNTFPDAYSQRSFPAKITRNKETVVSFAWELTAEQIVQLEKDCAASGINFDCTIYVRCGDNPIRIAKHKEWCEKSAREQTERVLKKLLSKKDTRIFVPAGKLPQQVSRT